MPREMKGKNACTAVFTKQLNCNTSLTTCIQSVVTVQTQAQLMGQGCNYWKEAAAATLQVCFTIVLCKIGPYLD